MANDGALIAVAGFGVLLTWSAVSNQKITVALQDIIKGKKPPPGPPGGTVTPASSPVLGTSSFTDSAGGGQTAAQKAANQALGKVMAAAYGWSTGTEWEDLNNIVMAESGWDADAQNPLSTAAGIAQNISGFSATYPKGVASVQIAWLLTYIAGRYGDPVKAWAFHLANGWY